MKHPENGCVNYGGVWTYYLEGKEVTEAEYEAVFPPPEPGPVSSKKGRAWPMLSDALACHPDQVDAMNERNARSGISVTYDRTDGRAIIPDRAERRKLLKREGLHDRNGGYGDG